MANRYADFPKDVEETLGHCGAMKKYFDDAIADLEKLGNDLNQKDFLDRLKRKDFFKEAKRNLTRANRTGLRVNRSFNKVKETMEKISKDEEVYEGNKKELAEFQRLIASDDAFLTRETSYFVGKLGDDIDTLGIQLGLLKKEKQSPLVVLTFLEKLVTAIKDVIAESGDKVGLMPFMAGLKNNLLSLAIKIKELDFED
ncbi:MAG: hypothetical protein KJ597_01590 [Nanoarchaeota archaeon]|nr:hypothetical protein [Nanoarchaeota archaeon]MBU1622245.1 hypothetical protein [Nanoarchaeota archaeon]